MMISSPSFTNIHSFVSDEFNRLRMQARKGAWLAKLFGKSSQLKILADAMPANLQNKRYKGVQNIPVSRIVGTLNRSEDFDADFRPRQKHLRNRWVNVFLLLDAEGWSPIIVHQVGNEYYVEDGHHRVSVARSVGMMFLEAEVWDHSGLVIEPLPDRSPCPLASVSINMCAAD